MRKREHRLLDICGHRLDEVDTVAASNRVK